MSNIPKEQNNSLTSINLAASNSIKEKINPDVKIENNSLQQIKEMFQNIIYKNDANKTKLKEFSININSPELHKLFSEIDTSSKCKISLNDLDQFLNKNNLNYDTEILNIFMRQCETNNKSYNNNNISYEDFLNFFSYVNPDVNVSEQQNAKLKEEINNIFLSLLSNELDIISYILDSTKRINKLDDFVTYDLFIKISNDEKYIKIKNLLNFLGSTMFEIEEIEELINRFDLNKDGKISYEEFKEIFYPFQNNLDEKAFFSEPEIEKINSTDNENLEYKINSINYYKLHIDDDSDEDVNNNVDINIQENSQLSTNRKSQDYKKDINYKLNNKKDISTKVLYSAQEKININNFIKFINFLALLEKKSENLRESLVLCDDFTIRELFYLFDINKKNYISVDNFKLICKNFLVIFPNLAQINLIFKRYDIDKDTYLNLNEFINMLTPLNQQYLCILKEKEKLNKVHQFLSFKSKETIIEFFKTIIENETNIHKIKGELLSKENFSCLEVWSWIMRYQGNVKQSLDKNELYCFLENFGCYLTEYEMDIIFNRFTRGKSFLTYEQFCREMID